jgi:hypothetical protein
MRSSGYIEFSRTEHWEYAKEDDEMRLLYIVSKGMNDPTLASVALHIAANGSPRSARMCPWSSLGTLRTW